MQLYFEKVSERDPNPKIFHIWQAYLHVALEIVKQDKCPKYSWSSKLLSPTYYCVQQFTVSTLVFNIQTCSTFTCQHAAVVSWFTLYFIVLSSQEFIAFNRLSAFWGGKCWFFSIYKVASFTDSLLIKITFLLRERKRKNNGSKVWQNIGRIRTFNIFQLYYLEAVLFINIWTFCMNILCNTLWNYEVPITILSG